MKKLNKNKIALGLATLVMGLGGNAMAAEQTASVQVNASILPSCTLSVIENVSIPYNPTVTSFQGEERNVSVLCTKTTPYSFGMNWGNRGSGAGGNRVLKSGENFLTYRILIDKTGGVLGEAGNSNGISGVGSGEKEDHLLKFSLNPKQYVPTGTYTDQLVVTFNY